MKRTGPPVALCLKGGVDRPAPGGGRTSADEGAFRGGYPGRKASSIASLQARALTLLKEAVLQDYSYRDLRVEDWERRFSRFGPQLRASRTPLEFALRAAKLLSAAKDIHLWLRVKDQTIPTHRRHVERNIDLSLLPWLIRGLRRHSPTVASGGAPDGILYLCLFGWPAEAPQSLQPAYRLLRHATRTRQALIIDVRANGGGSEPLATRFAGCFIRHSVCYARHQTMRAGALSKPIQRRLGPNRAGPRYRGRVAVLIGPGTVSSCESFAMMMRQVPGCKLIGQRTAGASGNPKAVDLGNGVIAFVPSWQDLDLDGVCLEGRGIAPDIEVAQEFSPRAGVCGRAPEGRNRRSNGRRQGAGSEHIVPLPWCDRALAAALDFLRRPETEAKSAICEACGFQVPPRAPQGLCPRCLLQAAM